MSESEYIQEVMRRAVITVTSQTPLQHIVAEHMVGELDGSSPGGVEEIIRRELRKRISTPRYKKQPVAARQSA